MEAILLIFALFAVILGAPAWFLWWCRQNRKKYGVTFPGRGAALNRETTPKQALGSAVSMTKGFIVNLARGAAVIAIFGGIYVWNQVQKENSTPQYVQNSSADRQDVRFEGYKNFRFGTTLAEFKRRLPCLFSRVHSDEPSVTVLACDGGKGFAGAQSVGFYFIGGTLQRLALSFPPSQNESVAAELRSKYGPAWVEPNDRLIASAEQMNSPVDYTWGANQDLILRGTNDGAMVIYSSVNYADMLKAAKNRALRGGL